MSDRVTTVRNGISEREIVESANVNAPRLHVFQHCSRICAAKSRLQWLSNAKRCAMHSLAPLLWWRIQPHDIARGYTRSATLAKAHTALQTDRQTDGWTDGRTVPYRETFGPAFLSRTYIIRRGVETTMYQRSKLTGIFAIGIYEFRRETINNRYQRGSPYRALQP